MADAHIRELERRWRETSSAGDEAAWLLARLRVGELDHARLALLARVGGEGARLALADPVSQPVPGLIEWGHGLVDAGARVAFRAALAVAEATVAARWESAPRAVAVLLTLLRREADGAGAQDVEALRQAAVLVEEVPRGGEREQAALAPLRWAGRIALHGRRAARAATIGALRSAASMLGEEAARRATSEALIPWLRDRDGLLDEGPTPPVRLVVVEDTFGVTGRGTLVQPEVDLELDLGPLEFSVEVRHPGASALCCRVAAVVPHVHPFDPARAKRHVLLLRGVSKQDVPHGAEVWEVGP